MLKLSTVALPGLLVLALASPNAHHPSSAIFKTHMQTTHSWDGTAYRQYPAGQPQITVLKITIPPHTTLKWHTHSVPNSAYILSGSLTVEKSDGAKRHFVAGDAIAEIVNSIHRGVTGNKPAVLIVFYAGAVELPHTQPAHSTPKRQSRGTKGA